jgi:hypothetical protein
METMNSGRALGSGTWTQFEHGVGPALAINVENNTATATNFIIVSRVYLSVTARQVPFYFGKT